MGQINMTLQIDEETKKQADELFSEIGLSTSTAVTIFLRKALKEKGFPFDVTARSTYSVEDSQYDFYNPDNLERIKKSVQQLDNGEGTIHSLIEVE